MAEITNKFYNGEPLKVEIYFEDAPMYTITTEGASDGSGIISASFNFNEGNCNADNILGIMTSNSLSLQLFDAEDKLTPANTESIYYGKCVRGVKIKTYISYNGEDWLPYGTWYTSSWSSIFKMGGPGYVNISCDDVLSIIGNKEIPEVKVYSDIQAGTVLANLFTSLGLSVSEYYIDPRLNFQMPYGVAQGDKVRDTLNNICQLLLARVIVNRYGVICVVPALLPYNGSNNITLEAEDIADSIENKMNKAVMYNKVQVKYLIAQGLERAKLYSGTKDLDGGVNNLDLIKFKHKVLTIENINISNEAYEGQGYVLSINYTGYMDGVSLNVTTSDEIKDAKIYIEGMIYDTDDNTVEVAIPNSSSNGQTFNFDSQQMLSSEVASLLATNITNYINSIKVSISLSNSGLTPALFTGDTITIENTNTLYDGVFKITGMNVNIKEGSYSSNFELIRVAQEE
jgi:hypothetical protein